MEDKVWTVLLLGGCSGTGKSALAPSIANRFGAELGQVDDYRMALQSATTPESHPELHFFISAPGVPKRRIWETSPEVLCDALIKIGEFVSSTLEVVINHHISTGKRIVLEGDGITPEMVIRLKTSNDRYRDGLRAVFLYEPSKDLFFLETNVAAGEPVSELNKYRLTIKTMHWLYGQWIVEEASKANLPLVQSRPWERLHDRVVSAITQSPPI